MRDYGDFVDLNLTENVKLILDKMNLHKYTTAEIVGLVKSLSDGAAGVNFYTNIFHMLKNIGIN